MSEGRVDDGLAVARHWLQVRRPERALDALATGGPEVLGPRGLAVRSAALLQLDRDDEAADAARRGLAAAPDDVGLLRLLALAERRRDRLGEAERALLAALRQEPSDAWLLADYAQVLAMAGQGPKARAVVDRALALAPGDVAVLRAAALVALHDGRDADAARYGDAALAADPDDAGAHAARGSAAAVRGDVSGAQRHLHRAAAQVGDSDLRAAAREASYLAHPLMVPLRPVVRWGPARVWLFGMALLVLSATLLPPAVGGPLLLAWFAFVVYTWVVPPLLRRWLRRGHR